MTTAIILTLLTILFCVNILFVLVLRRLLDIIESMRRLNEKQLRITEQLAKELMTRLPRLPYGVDADSVSPDITIGPYDSRIPH